MSEIMRTLLFCLLLALTTKNSSAQGSLYFPSKTINAVWDTVSPASLGWCTNYADTLNNFLDSSATKGFIILKDGKIAYEKYFGTFTQDSLWYWASAGKTITSLLIGVAQEEGLLNITDTSSTYLGTGWTNCTPAQEEKITIRHQLTMTSGIDDNVTDLNCITPSCLNFLVDPGTRWAYHNALYLLLQNVIENASGVSYNTYTTSKLKSKTGMIGFWFDGVYYSRPRDMARFGLMILNNGIWDSDTVLHDQTYFQQMIQPSQSINESYGYLWWLNGYNSYMLPQLQLVFSGELIPNAPSDLFCGLGKNDQKLYIIPSQNMVIIRMGDPSGTPAFALTNYDNELWARVNQFVCTAVSTNEINTPTKLKLFPNPASKYITITNSASNNFLIFDSYGKSINVFRDNNNRIDISNLSRGMYFISDGLKSEKLIVE
jgi:CubicO group peptidase (beta-lactamase class C family)